MTSGTLRSVTVLPDLARNETPDQWMTIRMQRRTKKIIWVGTIGLLLIALGTGLWVRHFHRYTPVEAVKDLRAAAAVRNAPQPVERFLELRYGSQTEPQNRQAAFLDFFNVGHIQGLQLITSHMPPGQRQTNIAAMAQWIAEYRKSMTPAEKEALRAHLCSEAGHARIQKATAQYLGQDVRYRAATAPVITELMTTLTTVQQP